MTEKTISQKGAGLLITISGNPKDVEREFNRLLNCGVIQMSVVRGEMASEWTPDVESLFLPGESHAVTFRSNLPRFERGLSALAVLSLRTNPKRYGKLKQRRFSPRRALALAINWVRSEFSFSDVPIIPSLGVHYGAHAGTARHSDGGEE